MEDDYTRRDEGAENVKAMLKNIQPKTINVSRHEGESQVLLVPNGMKAESVKNYIDRGVGYYPAAASASRNRFSASSSSRVSWRGFSRRRWPSLLQ